jgi:hypothetical protein
MDARARATALTWTTWGLAAAVLGLANLAVMGFDPVPGQHAVVGTAIPVVTLLAALASQAAWPGAPRWAWIAAWLGGTALAFLSAFAQAALGAAFLYDLGDAGRAAEEAPFALLAAFWSAGLTCALRGTARGPGLLATAAFVGLYVWASSWSWGGKAGALYGSALLNGAILVVFAATGWASAWATGRRTPAAADPVPG